MKKMIHFGLIMLILIMSIPSIQVEAATLSPFEEEARTLVDMKLISYSSTGYDLEKVPTRLQGAVMMVRLLGKEKEVLAQKWTIPFNDVPEWGIPYVGYLYKNQLCNGINETTFGTGNNLKSNDFMTFTLRALGYSDSVEVNDFNWSTSLDFANKLGLLTTSEITNMSGKSFVRGNMFHIAYRCLNQKMKGQKYALANILVNNKTIPLAVIISHDDFYDLFSEVELNQLTVVEDVKNKTELMNNLLFMIHTMKTDLNFKTTKYNGDIDNDLNVIFDQAFLIIEEIRGYKDMIENYSCEWSSKSIALHLNYYSKSGEVKKAIETGNQIYQSMDMKNKNDYEKIKLIHDYIVTHTTYDIQTATLENERMEAYTLVGVFRDGLAVCSGYADAMNYLCHLADIPCVYVEGYVNDDPTQLHAWNIVQLNQQFYQIDATWDDPVMSNGKEILSYQYFNVTDKDLGADHQWDDQYPKCQTYDYNYYYYNQQMFDSKETAENYLINKIKDKETKIEMRTIGFVFSLKELSNIIGNQPNSTNKYVMGAGTNYVTVEMIYQ